MMNQAVVAALGAGVAYLLMGGVTVAAAAWYGGTVALLNTMLLAWRMRISGRGVAQEPDRKLIKLIRSSMERFFMVALLLAVGLVWLKLMPLPLLAGFALGQLTLVVSTIISGIEK